MSLSPDWLSKSSHLFRVRLDSAVVEGIISIVFDIFLICTSENLCQLICSNYNVRIVYDFYRVLSIRTRRAAFLGEAITGYKWMPYFLSVLLTICTICTILLGFSVDGNVENLFEAQTYQTYAELRWPPSLGHMEYEKLYRNSSNHRPELISKRLIVMALYDRCQVCTFETCELVAYAFKDEIIDDELVNYEQYLDKIRLQGECVTNEKFRDTVPVMRFNAQEQPNLKCDITDVDIGIQYDVNFVRVSISVGSCDIDIKEVICYNRTGTTLHCAGVGPVKEEEYLGILAVHNAGMAQGHRIEVWVVDLSRFVTFTPEQLQAYVKQLAFLISLDLLFDYQFGFAPFIHLSYNKTLFPLIDGQNRNVSDVNLRIAIPCLSFVVTIALFLTIFYIYLWRVNIYKRGRRNFNTFSSVSEILEVMQSDFGEGESRNPAVRYASPEIGVRQDVPRLGLQLPGETRVADAEWTESEIF